MPANYESRARYLALAIDARRAIDALVCFVETGQRDSEFNDALGPMVDALAIESTPQGLLASLQSRLSLGGLDERMTMKQVTSVDQRELLHKKLQTLLSPDADVQTAKEAVHLVSSVETRALHYFNAPRSAPVGLT